MFKGLANVASLMRSAQQMTGKMQAANEQLKSQRAQAAAGGGMVEVEVNGLGEVLRLTIDPQLVERGEREMIEDLVPAAVNQALAKAKQLHVEAMQSMTRDLDVPGLNEAIAQLTGDKGNDDGA
jgi:DNA-binding YbaB/EbfC family protein